MLAHRTMLLLTGACAKSATPRNEMVNRKGVVQMLPTASSLEAGNLARYCLMLSSKMAGGRRQEAAVGNVNEKVTLTCWLCTRKARGSEWKCS